MATKNINKIFYYIENIDYNMIIEKHFQYNTELKNYHTTSKKTLRKKYEFFIHNLISRQITSDNGVAYLSSTILQEVLGKDYILIIKTLKNLNIINCDDYYIYKIKSYGYWINSTQTINSKIVSLYYPDKNYCKQLNKTLDKYI